MQTTLAFAPAAEDLAEHYFDRPVLSQIAQPPAEDQPHRYPADDEDDGPGAA